MDERFEAIKKYNLWDGKNLNVGYVRTDYTEKIFSFTGNDLVKVLVGQRRVGKSYILRQLAVKLIQSGVNRKNIFLINEEFTDFDFVKTYKDLDQLVKLYKQEIKPEGRIYLFIDEIQNVEGWERFVNSYSQNYVEEYEIFISGSNSKMLSSELATLLSGRYVCFEILPLSYNEYLGMTQKENGRENYVQYMRSGGMPELFQLSNDEVRRDYVSALKDTVLLRDIIQRHTIRDTRLLEDVFVFLINNASNLLSVRNIVNYFKSKGCKTSYDTVSSYIGYIEEAFLIHKAERFNIKGKDTVSGVCKYYANDLSFNNYLYRGFGYESGYMLENLVYLELLRCGFNVSVGTIKDKEVDFVAMKGDRVIYVQTTYMLVDDKTVEREYSALEAINDSFEKIVVSLDDVVLPLRGGIKNVQVWNLSEHLRR